MPRGLTVGQKTELGLTTLASPIYCVRIRRKDGTFLRWSERNPTFNDGTPSQTYEARILSLGGFQFGPDESGQISIEVANVDGQITTLDRAESFAGEPIEILAYLPGIDSYYIAWTGWCDDISEITPRSATLHAYPAIANPHVHVPQRTIGIPCTHVFGHTANWVNGRDFEGSECPYRRASSVGFAASLNGAINNSTTTVVARWGATPVAAGAKFKKGDAIKIDNEKMLITNSPADPDVNGDQTLTVTRAYQSTTAASHSDTATVLFSNCQYDTVACTRRGMYGNNASDTYSGRERNYFGGFPFITGWQFGHYRSRAGEKPKPLRLVFSGNESAYGRALPLVYGRVRIADPVLLLAKPEGDFLTTVWAVAEGVLATQTTDDDQTTPSNAYVKTGGVENIYVNGVSRHDPRPGYGIEVYNGVQDQPEPGSAFVTGIADFSTNHLGFWGTARVAFRINTKNNPSVDIQGQSITGSFEVAYGRVVRVYSDVSTYARKATTIPAWVLMDVMTSKRAGGGLDHARLNIQSFLDLASHCDTNVTSTFDASTVKRWTFNGILDTRQSYSEWVHRICIGCYALPPFPDKDGKLKVKALKSETLSGIPVFSSKVASATARNIIWDGEHSSLIKQRRPISEIPNEIRVNYVDKTDYAKVSLTVADRDSQIELGTKLGDQSRRAVVKSIDLPGASTLDEAARIATLILRAGEFGQGGLSNNLRIAFKAFHRDADDLEIGDIIDVEDDLLSAANNERYFRVTRITNTQVMAEADGGIDFIKEIEAVLHDNAMYDDTALTMSKYDRIDAPTPSDSEVPPVTSFGVTEGGIWDTNNKPMTRLTFTYTDPSPKENFRSVALHVTDDDGGGNPNEGAWRYIGDLYASGEIIENFEISNTRKHFCAVSRALSGHAMDVGTLTAAGAFKYPRASAIIDGITDTLPAPSNPQIFIGSGLVSLKWDSYTGNNLKLFRNFRVYRNTTNDLGSATLLASPDTNLFIDASVAAATTYYYWIKGLSVLNQEGSATSALSTTSPSDAGTDADVPDAPTLGIIRNYSSYNSNEYEWTIGIDKPGGAANWNTVNLAHLQIATDSGFSSLVLDREMSITEKVTTTFRVNKTGKYWFRARVKNAFGYSAYSTVLNRTTTITDANLTDTDLVAAATLTIKKASDSGYSHLAGNQFAVEFNAPSAQAESFWGYTLILHTSNTLPTATTDETGTGGALDAGTAVLTDTGKAWTVNAYVDKDVVIFSTKRGGSPTWDYEGVIYIAKITANTATTLTFDLPANRVTHTLTGLKYYIVTPGNHFYDKVALHAVGVDEGVTTPTDQRSGKRRITVTAGSATMYAWLALNNMWGHGKVQASPSSATFPGLTTGELKDAAVTTAKLNDAAVTTAKIVDAAVEAVKIATAAVTTTKIADDSVTTPKLVALSVTTAKIDALAVTAAKISVGTLDAIAVNAGTITAGTFIGTTFKTASSGARIELDATNGLRAYDSGGAVRTHIPIGTGAGYIRTGLLIGDSTTISLTDNSESGLLQVAATTMAFSVGGLDKFSASSSQVLAEVAFKAKDGLVVETSSTSRFQVDSNDSSSQTAMLVRQDGLLRRVKTVFKAGFGPSSADVNVLYVD